MTTTTPDRKRRRSGSLRRLFHLGFTIAAVVQELRLPKEERTWHGAVWLVPYDLRVPTPARLRHAWWDPGDDRIVGPAAFGVGWALNLPALARGLGSIGRRQAA